MPKSSITVTVIIPALFVVIWSTGWAVILFVLPYADPMTFLAIRFAIASVVVALFAWFGGAPFPRDRSFIGRAMLSGVFLHGLYLCCVWTAIANGVPTGISALISALQPMMTAVAAPYLLGERLSPIRTCGIILGFVGIIIALIPQLSTINSANLVAVLGPILINVVGMASLTGGTFYQKRALAGGDLRVITALQYVGAFAVTLLLAWSFEPMHVTWNLESSLAMAWNVFGISIGGIALLLFLIRRGEVSRAATLIYLVPPTSAIEIWLVKGIVLSPIQLAGMAVTVAGVALASRK
jgi:drug/metabolite transporter (DMT)-like permease